MTKKTDRPLERREALKGIAALAVVGPTLGNAACGSEDAAGEGSGTGGSAPMGGSAGAGSGATGGSGGTGGSGASGGSSGSLGAGGSAGAGTGGSAGAGTGGSAGSGATGGSGGGSGSAGTDAGTVPPPFDDPGTCMLTTTDIEGPFYIDDAEVPDDASLVRSDIREGHAGVEFRFHFRLLDARKNCAPITGA